MQVCGHLGLTTGKGTNLVECLFFGKSISNKEVRQTYQFEIKLSLIETYTVSLQVHTTTNSEISYHQSTTHNRVDRLKERVYTSL